MDLELNFPISLVIRERLNYFSPNCLHFALLPLIMLVSSTYFEVSVIDYLVDLQIFFNSRKCRAENIRTSLWRLLQVQVHQRNVDYIGC